MAPMVAPSGGTLTEASLAELYGIAPPPVDRAAKKARVPAKQNPRELSALISAAARDAKKNDAASLKALGDDPNDERSADGQRTGLRNLGATCYMNSLLQALFMNQTFRRGVYSWQPAKGKASTAGDEPSAQVAAEEVCTQLQRTFAHLQHSSRSCYDPAALTKALSLDVGVQQDAQEFNKLLLSFLEDKVFSFSRDPSVKALVQSLFRGEYKYTTTCEACKQLSSSSHRITPFYELELNLKPRLEDSLAECGAHRTAKHLAALTSPDLP